MKLNRMAMMLAGMVLIAGVALATGADPQSLKQNTIPTLQTATMQYPSIAAKLQTATSDIENSLLAAKAAKDIDPDDGTGPLEGRELFLAPDIIDPDRGGQCFANEESAVGILVALIQASTTPSAAKPTLQGVVNDLIMADKAIVQRSLNDGQAFLGGQAASNKDFQKAQVAFTQAQTLNNQAKYAQAIAAYHSSWTSAEKVAAPHIGRTFIKGLIKLTQGLNLKLDKISLQPVSQQNKLLKSEGDAVVKKANALQATLDSKAQALAVSLGIPKATVLARICTITGLARDGELQDALVHTILRVDNQANAVVDPAKTSLLAAEAALRSAGKCADITPPVITNLTPAAGSVLFTPRPPMSAGFKDALSGVDPASIVIMLDSVNITSQANVSATGFSFTPSSDLSSADHTLSVMLSDKAGNALNATITFTVHINPPVTPQSAFLDGIVTDAITDQPVQNAVVAVQGVTQTVLTDAQGKFAFPTPGTGIYLLEVTKTGYHYSDRKVEAFATKNSTVQPVHLMPAGKVTHIIAANGGVATSADNSVVVTFPPGAIPYDQDITITPIHHSRDLPSTPPEGQTMVAAFFGEPTQVFLQPLTVRMNNTLGFQPGSLVPIMFWGRADQEWIPGNSGTVSNDGQYIVGTWTRFSSGGYFPKAIVNGVHTSPYNQNPVGTAKPINSKAKKAKDPVGFWADYKSGDLALQHTLPSLRSMGVSNALTLRYDLSTASPNVLMGMASMNPPAISQLGGDQPPLTTQASFDLEGSRKDVTFQGGHGIYTTRTLQPAVDAQGQTLATGIYPVNTRAINAYNLNIGLARTDSPATIRDTGIPAPEPVPFSGSNSQNVTIENRVSSPLGAGWAFQGIQRIYPQQDKTLLLTDGDGGTATFHQDGDTVLLLHADPNDPIDYSGHGNNAHLENSAEFTFAPTAVSGSTGSFLFNGVDSQVNCGNDPSLRLTEGDFSISCWVRFNDNRNVMNLVVKQTSHQWPGDDGWRLIWHPSGNFWFYASSGQGGAGVADPVLATTDPFGTYPLQQWFHLVVTKTSSQMALYVNGVLKDSKPTPFIYDTNAGQFMLGRSAADPTSTFNGSMDEVKAMKRAMSAAEVAAEFNAAQATPNPIVDHWAGPLGDFSKIVLNNDGSYTRTFPDGTGINFNAQGLETVAFDRHNNQTVYTYVDATGSGIPQDLSSVRVPSGTQAMGWNVTYQNGKIASITDTAGRPTLFTVDGNGDLTQIKNPDNTTRGFQYLVHRCTQQTDENGNSMNFTFVHGMLSQVKYPQRTVVTVDSLGNAQTTTGQETRTFVPADTKGLVDDVAAGTGTPANPAMPIPMENLHPVANSNDASMGFSADFTDGTGAAYNVQVDEFGGATRITDPLGRFVRNYRDQNGLVQQAYSLDGNNSLGFAYNSVGLATLVNNSGLSAISTFTYTTDFNQVASMTDANGNMTAFGYTAQGDPQTITDAANHTTTITYTSDGLLERGRDALNQETAYTYDSATRNVLTITTPLNKVFQFTYAVSGNVQTATDPLLRVASTVYDVMGRISESHDPNGAVTKYVRDSTGKVLDVEDPLHHHTSFVYYPDGLLASTQNAIGQSKTLFYDASGFLSKAVNARSQEIKYHRDVAHQLVQKFLPGDEVDVAYSTLGLPISLEDTDSKMALSYDVAGRATTQQTFDKGHQPAVTLTQILDKVGNRTKLTDPTGDQTYVPNVLNLLDSISNPTGVQISMGYDTLSRPASITRSNGINSAFTYDAAGRLDTLTHGPTASPLGRFHFGLDDDGNRTSLDDLITLTGGTVQSGTHNFGYDVLNRLTSATHPSAQTFNPAESFQFDAVGNRTGTSEVYDQAYRLQGNAAFGFQWDADGNMIQKVRNADGYAWQFTWDAENQLTEVDVFANGLLQPRTSLVTYRYDPKGRRIEKNVDGAITRYVYDNQDILLEYSGSNALQARYTHGPGVDEPLIVRRGGQDYFFHQDGMNSVRMVTNSAGQVVHTQDFASFGKLVQETGTRVSPYSYTGREYDSESGLYCYRARYYDSEIGRFLSEDPIQGVNLYTYAENSPLNFFDPLGLKDYLVAFWDHHFMHFVVGHAAIFDTDGNLVLSSFPSTRFSPVGGNTPEDYKGTSASENGPPDSIFLVHVPDDQKFNTTVGDYSTRWLWVPYPFLPQTTNCVDSVSNALKAGGVPVGTKMLLPSTLESELRDLAKKQKETMKSGSVSSPWSVIIFPGTIPIK